MTEELAQQIRQLAEKHNSLAVAQAFIDRLESEEGLTRDENPATHYCVYFAAFDPASGQIFIGHHIKSGLWLFNGGHIDVGETAEQTLLREMDEEWGLQIPLETTGEPKLLTITEIKTPVNYPCKRHYDIWYFVPVDQNTFTPDPALLAKEYHKMAWLSPGATRERVTDPNTQQAIALIEDLFDLIENEGVPLRVKTKRTRKGDGL